jgi:hypothetical protein
MISRDCRLIGVSIEFVDGDDRRAVIAQVFDPGEKRGRGLQPLEAAC